MVIRSYSLNFVIVGVINWLTSVSFHSPCSKFHLPKLLAPKVLRNNLASCAARESEKRRRLRQLCSWEWKMFVSMGVSKNNGIPKSSIFIGFSIVNHPFWGTTIFGNIPILLVEYLSCKANWHTFAFCMLWLRVLPLPVTVANGWLFTGVGEHPSLWTLNAAPAV